MDITKKTASDEQAPYLYNEISRLNNELVTAHREIVKKNVELEKLSSLKNQFLGMAAHDLRSPISSIITFSEFLSEDCIDIFNEEQIKFMDIIKTCSRQTLNIINDFLDISVIENQRLNLRLENIDLISVISDIILIYKTIAIKKGVELIFEYIKVPQMMLDATKITQLLSNLISNAIKFSYESDKVFVRLSIKDNNVLIVVEDEGQGIPEKEIDKLFKPFTQTSIQSIGGEKSTGLGLTIVNEIVKNLNGTISATSKLGVGTKFIVSFPIN